MKKNIFIACLLLIFTFNLHAQSDDFLAGVDTFLESFAEKDYSILDHGGNLTNAENVIFPDYSVFKANEKYSLVVLIENCGSCVPSVQFVFKDGTVADIDLNITRNNSLTIAQYHFKENKQIEGEFEIRVLSSELYYTYMILVVKE